MTFTEQLTNLIEQSYKEAISIINNLINDKKSLKVPKGQWESVYRRTDNVYSVGSRTKVYTDGSRTKLIYQKGGKRQIVLHGK